MSVDPGSRGWNEHRHQPPSYIHLPATSVSYDSPAQYGFATSKLQFHIVANAYWDGTNWLRYDIAQPSFGIAVFPGGTVQVLSAAAGANPISWAVAAVGLDFTSSLTWTPLVYSNTWTDYGSGYSTGAWWKDPFGVVHLRGLIARTGAPVNGETIATLPSGARPPGLEQFIVRNSGGSSPLYVSTAGLIQWGNDGSIGTPQTFLSLAGVTFRTT